jgi:uncharacterized protein YndB with AHSA1/START domain
MRDPDGNDFPNRGFYLDIIENERLVFTDAYTKVWEPSEKLFRRSLKGSGALSRIKP